MNYFWLDLNYLDLIIIAPIVLGAFMGFRKGLVIEIASLAALVLGVYGAMNFSFFAAEILEDNFEWSPSVTHFLSLTITFIAIVFVVHLVARGVQSLVKLAALGIANRIAGMVFGMMKYTLIIAILVYLFQRVNERYPFVEDEVLSESFAYSGVAMIVPTMYPAVEEYIQGTN